MRPESLATIQLETEKIQKKREKSHLRDTHERDQYAENREWGCDDECDDRRERSLETTKNPIRESSPDHHDRELAKRESEDDHIFIFYLYWNFILHRLFG